MLHRLSDLDARVRHAAASYDWAGLIPELHGFCATDLSAFYFDIRKDSLYCDRPDAKRRRAARTVLDHLHRCLCLWLAPTLVFTAEEAWTTRFGEEDSVHLHQFPTLPAEWRNEALAAKWARIRARRDTLTAALEKLRATKEIGASLQAALQLDPSDEDTALLPADEWAELTITSHAALAPGPSTVLIAPGEKCLRCWRVLPEVGSSRLCLRCSDAVQTRQG
jgi:isoleucyl-tRNA synthetase